MKRRKLPGKTSWRSALTFFGVFLPAALVVVLVSAGNYRRELRSEVLLIKENEERLLGFERALVADQLSSVLEDFKLLASRDNLQEFITGGAIPTMSEGLVEDCRVLMREKREYVRLRVIGLDGLERLRLENQDQATVVAPFDQLQNVEDHAFFQNAAVLGPGEIHVSRIALDYSHDADDPEPLIRFSTHISGGEKGKGAILTLDYEANHLIRRIEEASTISFGRPMLLDPEGYWLYSDRPQDRWGSVIADRSHRVFAADYPEVWESIAKKGAGTQATGEATFYFSAQAL